MVVSSLWHMLSCAVGRRGGVTKGLRPMRTILSGWTRGGTLLPVAGLLAMLLTSGCVGMTARGTDCAAYAEARLSMPRPLPNDDLGAWVADLDDRMTGACT